MLTRRSSLIALLSAVASLSLSTVACSQPSEEASGGEPQAISATGLLTIDPSLPFEVARVHVANGPVIGATWGAHNGPVTSQDFSAAGVAPEVTRWIVPTAVGAPMMQQPWKTTLPPDLPAGDMFWGRFVDLPFGNVTLQSYSGLGEHFTGEVLLFSGDYQRVITRAKANGFFSAVGVTDGTTARIVSTGLSGITTEPSVVHDNGLWASDITASNLVPANGSHKLFGWTGASGPIVLDNSGNLFVAAARNAPDRLTAIYGLTKGQTFAPDAVQPSLVQEADHKGTKSFAVASIPNATKGWLFAKAFDDASAAPIYARQYAVGADAITTEGDLIPAAITSTQPNNSISVFGDPNGNLWVAIEGEAGAWLVQLAPKSTP